jgi:SAM-dependent methyltransferase
MKPPFIAALQGLPWPLPALLAWGAGWAAASACLRAAPAWALPAGTAVAVAVALANVGIRRRAIAALGFPLSALALLGTAAWPSPVLWLLPLLVLLVIYPLRAWRDAPFFPTPAAALQGLDKLIEPAPARILDAGCGLGHGLAALQPLWPQAQLHGIEWSAPMAWLAQRRVRATVRRGDMWAQSWTGFDLVYLFQRPESMARAWAKAGAELDGWLVSLEFEVPGAAPHARLEAAGGRPVFIYRVRRDAPGKACFSRSTEVERGR